MRWLLGWFLLLRVALPAQPFHPQQQHILFILDASGSMAASWQGQSRFEVARNTLYHLVDSFERTGRVQFALRVFGAQFPKNQKNCTDSKLLIPFGKQNGPAFKAATSRLVPQGMTPIAYSIAEGAKDFLADSTALNAIILITDGNENCEGDPCVAAQRLSEKRIALKPFIIGVDVPEALTAHFQCVGTFINTHSANEVQQAVGALVRRTLDNTTVQVHLVDRQETNSITNVPMTFADAYSHQPLYNLVQTHRAPVVSDTIWMNPTGTYQLTVHTFPALQKNDITIDPGKNNVLALPAFLTPVRVNAPILPGTKNDARVVVRQSNIIKTQSRNETEQYAASPLRVQVLTTPIADTLFTQPLANEWTMPAFGTLLITSREKARLAILHQGASGETLEYRAEVGQAGISCRLQPGTYVVLTQPLNAQHAESSKSTTVVMEENKTSVLDL
ncbi:MAG: VWA domain-containing protein [Chitinophagales bacterium]